jgi:predicted phage terminase large subunit-like protein
MPKVPPRIDLTDYLLSPFEDDDWGDPDDDGAPTWDSAFGTVTRAVADGLDPTPLDEETALMEASFAEFCKRALPIFVPNDIVWSWPHDAITEHLQAVSDGQIRNLIINVPPRNLKSSIASVCWNAWEWIRNPRLRYLFTSYSMNLSIRDNDFTRQLIRSQWYQRRWGGRYAIRRDRDAVKLFVNTAGGQRLASSVTAGNTGEGGERIVVDDPHNALEADSEKARAQVLTWWTRVMSSRVNRAGASKVVIAQRVHHADLVGSLVDMMVSKGGEPYERLIIPMEYDPKLYVTVPEMPTADDDDEYDDDEEDEDWLPELPSETPDAPSLMTLLDPEDRPQALIPRVTALGWRDPRARLGELMVPDQWPQSFVDQQKITAGPYAYSAQYQQAPSPSEGGRFKEHYWGRYEFTPMWHRGLRPEIIVVDSAYGEEGGDPTGVSVWGKSGGRLYVLWAAELTEDTPNLRRKLRDIHAKWKVPFLIENKANGRALIQDLKRGGDDDRLPSLPVIPFNPDGLTKEARAFSVVNYVAGGMVYLPEGHEWVFDWIQQHKVFPKGQHDDLVDTTAMAITWLAKRATDIRELIGRPQAAPYGADTYRTPTEGYWT